MAEEENKINLPGRFAVYGAVGGKPAVVARFEDNDVWLTQKQLADLFNTTKQLVSHHIRQIIDSGELDRNRTVKKYLTVQTEGTRSIGRHVDHYNLDFAEYKALAEEPMSMSDWVAALDDQLKRLHAKLLTGKGKVSHEDAMEKAEREFTIYRQREMRQLKSDFDKAARGYLGGPTGS
jgi:hypothetical protein